jgi:hypothetical protein
MVLPEVDPCVGHDAFDGVCCRLCCKQYKTIAQHLYRTHGLTREQYEAYAERFPVQCRGTKQKITHFWEHEASEEFKLQRGRKLSKALGESRKTWSEQKREQWKRRMSDGHTRFEAVASADFREERRRTLARGRRNRWADTTPSERYAALKPAFRSSRRCQCVLRSGAVIPVRSTWEVRFMTYLDGRHLDYFYEPEAIPWWDRHARRRYYTPDFYLPAFDLIVEVKPQRIITRYEDTCRRKKEAVLREGYRFCFVTETELEDLSAWEATWLWPYANQQPSLGGNPSEGSETSVYSPTGLAEGDETPRARGTLPSCTHEAGEDMVRHHR